MNPPQQNLSAYAPAFREVRQLLKALDPSKAAGQDEIPPAALKMVADEIAFPGPYRSSSMNRSQLVSYQMNSKLVTFTRSSSRAIQLKESIELSWNHVDMRPLEGSGESRASLDIQTFRIIWGPTPLHSLDFVEAIHALICCCQLLMTGSLHEIQSYAQRLSSLTYLKLLAMWIINPFCSSFKNAES